MAKLTRKQKTNIVEAAEAEIERQQTKTLSRQPRFDPKAAFAAWLNFWHDKSIDPPPYQANSMQRDQFLQGFWRKEPHIAGVVNQVTTIDTNRGWELVGGKIQVARYSDILHEADGGAGWRAMMRRSSLSFWTTDMGSLTEIGREGRNGPMRALYHVDPGRCYLTGLPDTPLAYQPAMGGQQFWGPLDFFRICSLPSDIEAFRGLGYSALSRAIELVRVLYAVMVHDQEMLAARAPKGLLLLQGISEQQWIESLQAREENLDSLERTYYGGVQVLASMGADQVDAKLVGLSQLPQNFDAEKFYQLSMYSIALCFGYDSSEFFPVQFGALGRGTETEVQHQKATGKGGVDFALSWQEMLQRELPATLHWEFEQRDDAGELQEENVKAARLNTIAAAYNAGIVQGAPLISRQEARTLLAEAGIIPPEWTEIEEDVTATDTEEADAETTEETPSANPAGSPDETPQPTSPGQEAQRLLDTPEVRRAMAVWPREQIVRYSWHNGRATMRTLYTPKRRLWPVARADDEILYKSGDVVIKQSDVDKAIADARKRTPDVADLLEATTAEKA
jgi:hypothetical protein